MRACILSMVLLALTPAVVRAGEATVIDGSARFPEGPVWQDGKLFYVEYGGHTVKSWDGTQSVELWKSEGCGPSAVAPFGEGFLVTCYDAGTMVRIGADGKTLETIDRDDSGAPFIGPNDIAPDGKGGAYFSASGPWESAPIVGKIYHMDPNGRVRVVSGGAFTRLRSPLGSTSSTSSFGSNGSFTGLGSASAARTSSIPNPEAGSRPGWSMSRADRRRISATWPAPSSGRTVQSHAAAPATIGDEKLVPDEGRQSFPTALATTMSSPGAAMST